MGGVRLRISALISKQISTVASPSCEYEDELLMEFQCSTIFDVEAMYTGCPM